MANAPSAWVGPVTAKSAAAKNADLVPNSFDVVPHSNPVAPSMKPRLSKRAAVRPPMLAASAASGG